jgi:hypothetical protein
MNYIVLKALMDSDPANAGKTDADVHAWLLEPDPNPRYQDVEWLDYMVWLGDVDGMERLDAAISAGSSSEETKGASRLALTIAQAGQDLALSDARVRSLLAKVVPSVFTTAERDQLLAMGTVETATRWASAGVEREPDVIHVTNVRAGAGS